MRIDQYIVLLLAAVMVACTPEPSVTVPVRQCAETPVGRASACVAVLDGKAYIFGGRDQEGRYLNDLWSYDPLTDTWTDLGETPMCGRVKPTMTAHGGKLYMGLGYSALRAYVDSAYLKDWYEYTPATNQWRQLEDFPNKNSVAAISHAEDGIIYVLYGNGRFFSSDVGYYSIANNSWELQYNRGDRALACFGACGAPHKGLFYFGTGFNAYNLTQWYAADVPNDHWQARRSIPGKGRQWSAATATNEYIYLFGGRYFAGELTGGEVFDTFLRYAPDKDRWEWCGTMPCGRAENQIAFTIGGKVYFGLGEDEKGAIINQLYCIEE